MIDESISFLAEMNFYVLPAVFLKETLVRLNLPHLNAYLMLGLSYIRVI